MGVSGTAVLRDAFFAFAGFGGPVLAGSPLCLWMLRLRAFGLVVLEQVNLLRRDAQAAGL